MFDWRIKLSGVAMICCLATGAMAVGPEVSDSGVKLDNGPAGTFLLEYPTLWNKDNQPNHKIIEKTKEGKKEILKYDGGGEIDVIPNDGGEIGVEVHDLPADAKSFAVNLLIALDYGQGGTYQFDAKDAVPFPKDKPAKPHLYQDHAASLTLKSVDGVITSLTMPPFAFWDLQDNRQWNWNTYAVKVWVPLLDGVNNYKITLKAGPLKSADEAPKAHARPAARIDEFGQAIKAEFSDKVKSVDALKADVESEKEYYASLHPPEFDPYGGLPARDAKLELNKTGFFHVEEAGGAKRPDGAKGRSILVDPAGNSFFAVGVCTDLPSDDYTYIGGRQQIYQFVPDKTGEFATAFKTDSPDVLSFHIVNQIRKYGQPADEERDAARMIERLRKWGFNTVGPFCTPTKAGAAANLPYVISLPLWQWQKYPIKQIPGISSTWDPFDETNVQTVEKMFASALPPRADDPLLLGYFLSNEPLFEDVPHVVPTLNGQYACKRKLVSMLREKYKTIDALNDAWALTAKSFDELNDAGVGVHTAAAAADMDAYDALFFETYYKLVAGNFHKYDSHHLLIGNRLQAGTINNEAVTKIAARYMDVISFNYYTYGIDKDFLKRIHGWTNKPMMLTEFFYDSPNDSGLPGGGKDVSSQRERGFAFRNYVEQAASLDFIVGIEWFTLVDQSVTGRWFEKFNGENGNSGLIAVTDRPWKPMIEEMMKTTYHVYDVMLGKQAPFSWDDPRFASSGISKKSLNIEHSVGPVKMDGTAAGFPGVPAEQISSSRLVLGKDAGGVEASFKLCWDSDNLYLLADVVDLTPMMNKHKPDMLWSGDGVELFIGGEQMDKDGGVLFSDHHLLLGGGLLDGKPQWQMVNAAAQPEIQMTVVPNVSGKGYVIEAAIPFSSLGFTPAVGKQMRFDLAVDDSEDGMRRDRKLMWNGSDRNSGDRTGWGRATFNQ